MATFNNKRKYINLDILHLHITTHCVVVCKPNIEMKTTVQTYNYLETYLDSVRAKGRYAFTVDELKDKFDLSDKAIHQNLYRLKSKKRIVQVRQGFYTVLPPEYSKQGMLPALLFIDDMMAMLHKKYYVALITAAAIHGASHQQSMETFVITEKPALRTIKNKKLIINFLVKNDWNKDDIKQVKTDAGFINVSSPELTALDLLCYVDRIGMNRVVTILSELVEVIKPANLNKTAKSYSQTAAVQRLGYLFENELKAPKLSAILYEIIATKLGVNIPLMPGKGKIGTVDLKWKINHNVTIESDL